MHQIIKSIVALCIVVSVLVMPALAAEVNDGNVSTEEGTFRVGPIVKVRPVNDVIDSDHQGLIEFYFSNPAINDVTLTAEVYVSVPSGIHAIGEGFGVGGAAGSVHGTFTAPPGTDRTVYLEVYGEKLGDHTIHAEVLYYPGSNKDAFQQISLTHPFTIVEPVPEPSESQQVDEDENASSVSTTAANPGWEPSVMWILLIGVVLGGVAIIFAVSKKSSIKIADDER